MIHPDDPDPNRLKLWLADDAASRELGTALAAGLAPGLHVWLQGELGSGKTTIVRAALRALGVAGTLRSPTYTLVELYSISRLHLYHLDLYRVEFPEEVLDAGLDETLRGEGICLVEWPEKAAGLLPPADLVLRLRVEAQGRCALVEARGAKGAKCLAALTRNPALKRLVAATADRCSRHALPH